MPGKIVLSHGEGGVSWVFISPNGRCIATSFEPYPTTKSALKGIAALKRLAPDAVIVTLDDPVETEQPDQPGKRTRRPPAEPESRSPRPPTTEPRTVRAPRDESTPADGPDGAHSSPTRGRDAPVTREC